MRPISILTSCFLVILFAYTHAFAWTFSADFESGQSGSKAQGTSGFHWAGTGTVFSTDQAASTSKSAKMVWPAGSDGWGVVQGSFDHPDLRDGSEIWVRGYFYFASPWSWKCSPVVKVMRVHIANSSGGNAGYHSVFADSDGNILASNEIAEFQPITGAKFDKDRWQCIEMYVKISTSDPIVRMWKDGNLIYENRLKTLPSSDAYADFIYMMTYWNGGAPQNQTQYVDDFVVMNERPSNLDNKGNPMIGTNGMAYTTIPASQPLLAPKGLKTIK